MKLRSASRTPQSSFFGPLPVGGESTESASVGVPKLQVDDVWKSFGAVTACRGMSFAVQPGEILGVLGENGAGKTTIMKIIIGLLRADRGIVAVDGRPVSVRDPQTAAGLGIAMVQQHFSLIDRLTVWENVALAGAGRLRARSGRREVVELAERYGLGVRPDAVVEHLAVGERQRVEILKCMKCDPTTFILDEPTAVLSPTDARQLFAFLTQLVRAEQRSVIFISHNIDEILETTDRVIVMRHGRVVAEAIPAETDGRALALAMVGREISGRARQALGTPAFGAEPPVDHLDTVPLDTVPLDTVPLDTVPADTVPADTVPADTVPADTVPAGTPDPATRVGVSAVEMGAPLSAPPGRDPSVALAITGARVRSEHGKVELDDFTLQIRRGEIVGLAGVEGNGQRGLSDLLSGLAPLEAGSLCVGGQPVNTDRLGAVRQAGVGVIPEDRHASGCVLDLSIAENLALDLAAGGESRVLLNRRAMIADAEVMLREYEISAPSPTTPFRRLSGGNQQRVVVARELSRATAVLAAFQPTRGLDVAAVEYMLNRLQDAAQRGLGVLIVSSELGELLALSHRVAVISRGRITGEIDPHAVDNMRLGLLMGGSSA